MLDQFDQITEACATISARWPHKPAVGLILGSGLGAAAAALTCRLHGRQEQTDERADDCDHDQQFDEGESSCHPRGMACRSKLKMVVHEPPQREKRTDVLDEY